MLTERAKRATTQGRPYNRENFSLFCHTDSIPPDGGCHARLRRDLRAGPLRSELKPATASAPRALHSPQNRAQNPAEILREILMKI